MATRPLRQHYATDGAAPVPVVVDPALASFVEPWRAHRARFLSAVRGLDAGDWDHATRCAEWSVRDVVTHLVTVDGFWPVAMATARDDGPPTTYLTGFDPSSSPDEFVRAATADTSDPSCSNGTPPHSTRCTRSSIGAGRRGLEPAVRVAARARPRGSSILAHGYWDSWLHEYDIFVPLGDPPAVERDDLSVATWFSLVMAALQGGLVDDSRRSRTGSRGADRRVPRVHGPARGSPAPLGRDPGSRRHGRALRVRSPCGRHGRAVDLVEGLTGRQDPERATDALPSAVAAQVRRASLIF